MESYTLHEATLNNIGRDYIDNRRTKVKNVYQNSAGGSKNALDRLVERIAAGALHNSAERGPHAPKCHPETRKAVQQQIIGWIRYGDRDDTPMMILWLSGPAGSGKTAIMGTIADECHAEGLLAASFFFSAFSVSVNRRSKTSFILTLAYGLLQQESIVGLKKAILSAIDNDPAIFDKHLDQQLDHLIMAPLQAVVGQSDPARWPKLIIIDGVDECGGDGVAEGLKQDVQRSREENHKEILSVLARASRDPRFPFRILIASRPEPAITEFFNTSPDPTLRLFLDDKYDPDSDIRLFLVSKLATIQRKYKLPSNWPPHGVVGLLVDRASGQFVYAATIIRFVENTSRLPQEQLKLVVEWKQRSSSELNPFASLDALYTGILEMSPNPTLAAKWLVCLNTAWDFDLTPGHSIGQASDYYKLTVLESSQGEATYLLGGLSSLVKLSDDAGEFEVSFYHKSILDFLGDASRSGRLHVDDRDAEQHIRDSHYQTLKNRGPRGGLAPHDSEIFFSEDFFVYLSHWIDPSRSYEVADVSWWWNQASSGLTHWRGATEFDFTRHLFFTVDEQCPRYTCRSSCKLWRKGIRQLGEAHGFSVPTRLDVLRDKIYKLRLPKDSDELTWWGRYQRPIWRCFVEGERFGFESDYSDSYYSNYD